MFTIEQLKISSWWLILIALVSLSVAFADNTYYLHILGTIAVTTLVGVGLNVLTGLSGLVSLGHAGFFAIGAYTVSLLTTKLQWNFWLAAIAGVILSAIVGAILAAPTLRVTGPYLAMVTIAFGIIIERILVEWVSLTGGFGGILNIPKPMLFGFESLRGVVVLAWVGAILALMFFAAIKNSEWGRAWQAVRDDEIAASSIGLNTWKMRIIAFAVSAAFTGLGGVFFAPIVGFISPSSFTFHRSLLFLLVAILGGLGTIAGSIVGAIALVIFPELVGNFAEYQLLFFGVLLLLTLWLAPSGVVSFFSQRFYRPRVVCPPTASLDLPSLIIGNKSQQVLKVEHMSISFGGVKAVDDVDLTANSGTITGIIGSNGAGKTTLLNLLTGLVSSKSGSVVLGTENLTGKDTWSIARTGMGRTFQTTRLFDSLSVLDNLKIGYAGEHLGNFFTALLGIARKNKSIENKLTELLAFVGYRGNIHTRADSLSFGDRRLVEIARTLATNPQAILLDEPAAGLGQQQRERLVPLLRCLADLGIIVLVIEHDINLVMQISDRLVVLDRGKVICDDIPVKVRQNPRVLEAYLGVKSDVLSSPSNCNSTTPILAVENITAGYGKLEVLQDVSLEVCQGELIAVVGANGAGKTTLLKSIAKLLTPRSGRVLFRGKNLTKLLPQQLAELGVVLIPEGRQVFARLTVRENLRLGAFYRHDSQINADINVMLERFPALAALQNRQAGSLSGGEQQMLAIARGLMAKPQILLLDEPSLGLAPQLVMSLYATLASLCESGISILLVDQMAQLAFSVAHRVYILETGKIVRMGTPNELNLDSTIINSYLGNSL